MRHEENIQHSSEFQLEETSREETLVCTADNVRECRQDFALDPAFACTVNRIEANINRLTAQQVETARDGHVRTMVQLCHI